jgi:hypothetical protein
MTDRPDELIARDRATSREVASLRLRLELARQDEAIAADRVATLQARIDHLLGGTS